jgi:HEAT repeat protein
MQLFKPNVEKLKAKNDLNGLGKALQDKDGAIRLAAAEALDQLGLPDDPCVQGWHAVVKQDWNRAVEVGADAIPAMIATLRDGDEIVRFSAGLALRKMPPEEAVPPLVELVRTASPEIKSEAGSILAGMGETAARQVAPLLSHKDEPVWREAISILQGIGDDAVPVLCEKLKEEQKDSMARVTGTLILMKSPAVVNGLIEALSWDAPRPVCMAIIALKKIGDPRAIGPLAEAMNNMSWRVVKSDARTLLSGDAENPRVQAAQALQEFGAPAVEILNAAKEHEDIEVRLIATLWHPKDDGKD